MHLGEKFYIVIFEIICVKMDHFCPVCGGCILCLPGVKSNVLLTMFWGHLEDTSEFLTCVQGVYKACLTQQVLEGETYTCQLLLPTVSELGSVV